MKRIVKLIGILGVCIILLTEAAPIAFSENTPSSMTIASVQGAAGNSGKENGTRSGSTNTNGEKETAASGILKKSIILYVGSPVAYVNGAEKRIDPANLEITPVIINKSVMVPVRFIAESLGGSARWNQPSLTATIVLGGKSYLFKPGSSRIETDSTNYNMGAAVQAYKGRILVPLEPFVRMLGKKAVYERGLIIISNKDIFSPEQNRELVSEWISKLSYLPVVGTRDKLMSLLKGTEKNRRQLYGGNIKQSILDTGAMVQRNAMKAEEGAMAKDKAAVATTAADSEDYSTTNVQVQGVDEGDIVKTDGKMIYQVNKRRVLLIKAVPSENMKVLSVIDYSNQNLTPREIYLQGQKLVVIASSQADFPLYKGSKLPQDESYPTGRFLQESTKVLIYDMANSEKVRLVHEIELQGGYVSSRKIGSGLYVVSNEYLDYYRIQNGEMNGAPSYSDSVNKKGFVAVNYNSIRYFPGAVEPTCMVLAGMDLEKNDAANVSAYLGAGQEIYASTENLYIAVPDYFKVDQGNQFEEKTQIYKFAMKDANLTYLCKGTVPGTILNQFSMDENGDTFRIATTKGMVWATDERISKNALYVLDSMLCITGKVEDMAPGENIYSVRFMQDRAYVVTYRTVDPLFVIDLKNPAKPAVLGKLKIPGYSNYLHPYDTNHIIGFGKDTVEMKGQAYYLGMKVALFDVTDVTKPVLKFSEVIGDRGTDSELLNNHKALLFSREKNLLAFPVTVMETTDTKKAGSDVLQYGRFSFQGALVYNLDLQKGFHLKGKITHLSAEDYLKAGDNWYDSDKNIQRILYCGDTLYTLSNGMIKANAIENLKEKGKVALP